MARFDVEDQRKLLQEPVGGFEWSLNLDREEFKALSGLASSALSSLGMAVECLVVGFDEPADRLLRQARDWVQLAIASGERPERYFPGATEASRFETLALCNWFLYCQHDVDNLQRFVEHHNRYLYSQKRRDKIDVSLGIVPYVDAGAFERTLEIFASTSGLSAPTSLAPRNEAQMAYILSRRALGLQYSQEDVRTAGRKFLARNIDAWFESGQWVRVAEWLKILYWNDSDRTAAPKQVLMKCYDFLAGRTPGRDKGT